MSDTSGPEKSEQAKEAVGVPDSEAWTSSQLLVARVCTSIGLVFLGGWSIVWRRIVYFPVHDLLVTFHPPTLAILFNGAYYGIESTNRFFNAPYVSLLLLAAAVGVMSGSKSS